MKFFEKVKIDDQKKIYYLFGFKILTRIKKKVKISKLTKAKKHDALITLKCLRSLNEKINTAETLVIGHSHARFGFIEDEKSINFGIDAQDLYYSYKILDKYKNIIPNLKNIVLFFGLFSPGNDLQLSPSNSYRTAYYDLFLDIPYKNTYFAYKDGVVDLAKNLKNIRSYVDKNLKNIPRDIMSQEHKNINPTYLEDKWINRAIKLNKKNTEMQFFKNILDICENKGFNITVVLSPYNPRIKNKLPNSNDAYGKLFEIAKNYSCIQILNFYDNDYFTDDDFLDIEHLSINGAKKMTEKINQINNKRF